MWEFHIHTAAGGGFHNTIQLSLSVYSNTKISSSRLEQQTGQPFSFSLHEVSTRYIVSVVREPKEDPFHLYNVEEIPNAACFN